MSDPWQTARPSSEPAEYLSSSPSPSRSPSPSSDHPQISRPPSRASRSQSPCSEPARSASPSSDQGHTSRPPSRASGSQSPSSDQSHSSRAPSPVEEPFRYPLGWGPPSYPLPEGEDPADWPVYQPNPEFPWDDPDWKAPWELEPPPPLREIPLRIPRLILLTLPSEIRLMIWIEVIRGAAWHSWRGTCRQIAEESYLPLLQNVARVIDIERSDYGQRADMTEDDMEKIQYVHIELTKDEKYRYHDDWSFFNKVLEDKGGMIGDFHTRGVARKECTVNATWTANSTWAGSDFKLNARVMYGLSDLADFETVVFRGYSPYQGPIEEQPEGVHCFDTFLQRLEWWLGPGERLDNPDEMYVDVLVTFRPTHYCTMEERIELGKEWDADWDEEVAKNVEEVVEEDAVEDIREDVEEDVEEDVKVVMKVVVEEVVEEGAAAQVTDHEEA